MIIWKCFNPDPSKQTQVIFSRKTKNHSPLFSTIAYQLGVHLMSISVPLSAIQCWLSYNSSDTWHLKGKSLPRIGLKSLLKIDFGLGNYVPLLKNYKSKSQDFLHSIIQEKISTCITRNIDAVSLFSTSQKKTYKRIVESTRPSLNSF